MFLKVQPWQEIQLHLLQFLLGWYQAVVHKYEEYIAWKSTWYSGHGHRVTLQSTRWHRGFKAYPALSDEWQWHRVSTWRSAPSEALPHSQMALDHLKSIHPRLYQIVQMQYIRTQPRESLSKTGRYSPSFPPSVLFFQSLYPAQTANPNARTHAQVVSFRLQM